MSSRIFSLTVRRKILVNVFFSQKILTVTNSNTNIYIYSNTNVNGRKFNLRYQTVIREKLQRLGVQLSERLAFFDIMVGQINNPSDTTRLPEHCGMEGFKGGPQLELKITADICFCSLFCHA